MAEFPDAVQPLANCGAEIMTTNFPNPPISKIIMDDSADRLGLLPLELDNSSINSLYHDFLGRYNPMLVDEQESFHGILGKSVNFVELVPEPLTLYFTHTSGLIKLTVFFPMLATLDAEESIDLHRDQFAWDAEAISFSDEDFSYEDLFLPQFSSDSQPHKDNPSPLTWDGEKRTLNSLKYIARPTVLSVLFKLGRMSLPP